MASPPFFSIVNTAQWLAALTQYMGVPNALGEREASENAAAPRVDWVPTSMATAKTTFRAPNAQTASNTGSAFDVVIVAADFGELLRVFKALVGGVDSMFGPKQGAPETGGGWQMGKSSKPVRGGVVGAEWWSTTVPVTLFELAERMFTPLATVATVNASTTALNPDGTTPTGDPLNPIEAT
jgi:hypothetical protein